MRIVLVILVLGSFSVNAQELTPVFEDTINEGVQLNISSFNYYSSNRFDNGLTDRFLKGGEITQEIKDRNSQRLKNYNAIGAESEQTIENFQPAIQPFGKEKFGMVMSFSDNHFVSSNIPSGLFNIGMYGNTNYLGDTLDLTFGHIQYQHYQKLSIGFYEKRTMSSIKIGYVAGSRAANFRLGESHLYNSPNGDSISADLSGEGFATERFYPYAAFLGGGFAVDVNFNFLFYSKKGNRQIVNLKINNLGMIFWNRNSTQYYIEDTSSYTGFEMQELFDQANNTSEDFDWKDSLGLLEATGIQRETLPLELIVQKLPDRFSSKKVQPIFGFKTILTSDYFPYVYAGVYYQPIENFSLSSRFAYGGFGGFKWGLNLNYWLKDKVNFYLGSYDLIGFVSQKYGMGRSLNFGANIKLKKIEP